MNDLMTYRGGWIHTLVMARKPGVEFEGALYHVIVRGSHRRDIFATEATAWPTSNASSITDIAIAASCTLTC